MSTLVSNVILVTMVGGGKRGGEHNNQPNKGHTAKMPPTEATQQPMTSQHDKRTRGWRNNDDAVERHGCSKVVQ
jgi:hypothetical protein